MVTIAHFASANPIQLKFTDEEDEVRALSHVLSEAYSFSNASLTQRVIQRCDAVCVWANYKEKKHIKPHYVKAVESVGEDFVQVQKQQPEDALALIHQIRFHFDYWGQQPVASAVLQQLRNASVVFSDESLDAGIISDVLDFWIQSLAWSKKEMAGDWRNKMADAHTRILHTHGENSKWSVAVLYIRAWIVIQLNDVSAAYDILSQHKNVCEQVFGPGQYQTIAWWRHLAYSDYHQFRIESGETIFKQLLVPNVTSRYGDEHPLYWAVKCQWGLLKVMVAEENKAPARREEIWREGIDLMKETLVWRGRVLGQQNPSTGKAFQQCKLSLQKWGETAEAQGLLSWFESQSVRGPTDAHGTAHGAIGHDAK